MTIVAEKTNTTFQLKGSLFTITVMQLHSANIDSFTAQLNETLRQAPKFFENAPIVIDLNEFNSSKHDLQLAELVAIMRQAKIVPIGIRGGDLDAQAQAINTGLAILHNSPNTKQPETKPATKKLSTEKTQTAKETPKANLGESTTTRVITTPVRSGQQIYAKNADLIVLSSVSHGAEILADGHIHVYGPLRGRALAGILGNIDAKIFCKSMDAELISIAGRYLVNEQLDPYKDVEDLHIHLNGEELVIDKL